MPAAPGSDVTSGVMASIRSQLPPGQRETAAFPRFGLSQFARRFPRQTTSPAVEVKGDVEQGLQLTNALLDLPRAEQVSDFHCVTTWSRRSLRWSSVARFARAMAERAPPGPAG